jgi:hypothetical protein
MRKGNPQENPANKSPKPSERSRRPANVDEDLEFDVDNRYSTPKIPEGIYQAVFLRAEHAVVFKTPKVFIWVKITDLGPWHGAKLYRAYRVRHKPGKNKKFVLGSRSELRQMLCRLSDVRVRADRLSLKILQNKVLRVSVRTVTSDYRQRALDEYDQYSVISDILSLETT